MIQHVVLKLPNLLLLQEQKYGKNPSYSFCGSRESGNNIRNFTSRTRLQQVAVEHFVCSTEHTFYFLLGRFEHDELLNAPSVAANLITNISSGKRKHICIHHVWSNNMNMCMII